MYVSFPYLCKRKLMYFYFQIRLFRANDQLSGLLVTSSGHQAKNVIFSPESNVT
jgi:hypothetical protein